MREVIDFRIPEENAARYLSERVGEHLSDTVRRVVVSTDDPLFAEIGRLQQEFRRRGDFFFLGRVHHRRYSRQELEAAELFHAWPKKMFEPAGEECGTVYDDTKACSLCGAGAPHVTPLFLDGRHVPRRVDFARTIANEIVVSARVVDLFREDRLSGADFDPVRLANEGGRASANHYQLKLVGPPVDLDPVTRFGDDPFDEASYGRCAWGDVAGLNLLSEVTVRRESLAHADVMATKQMLGVRRGLLRPRPILLLSPQAWRGLEHAKLKGLTVEVAHLS